MVDFHRGERVVLWEEDAEDDVATLDHSGAGCSAAQGHRCTCEIFRSSKLEVFPLIHQNKTVHVPEYLCTCSLLALDCNISFVVSDSTVRAC